MIGIDMTTISRFENINLIKLGTRLGQTIDTPMTAAKIWACLEAIIKAEQKHINPKNNLKFVFEKNKPPVVLDIGKILSSDYVLSLTHEGDNVIAVALKQNNNGINHDR
jgi:phosphopantetheinyl transferase (holo-ACP synthase)